MTLRADARTYLESENYAVTERPRGLLVGSRDAVGGKESIYVWVPASQLRVPERSLMAEFGAAEKDEPQARKFVLVETMEGIRTEFRSDALRYFRVQVNTPARFFDTNFRDEDAQTTAASTRALRQRGAERLSVRVAQPYRVRGLSEHGEDLLPTLESRLRGRGQEARPIHLVVGPAGIGKSHLFDGLFARLYESFQRDKRALSPARRPLPLIPEHLAFASTATMDAILDAFLGTEFTRPLNRQNFAWKLLHGYGTWLIDGLDEVISRDTGLFDWLMDLITRPDSPSSPSVLICLRDSVLATNSDLRDFMEDLHEHVQVYDLLPWSNKEKRLFAKRQLGSGYQGFMRTLSEAPALDHLASLPFYCEVLTDRFEAGELATDVTESGVIEMALERIIERERQKQLLDERFLSDAALRDLLEGVAAENMTRQFSGVDHETVHEWAQLVVRDEIPSEDRERLVTNLTQVALFAGGESRRVLFAQELIEQYLLGCYLVKLLVSNRSAFASRMGAVQIPWRWLTMTVIVDYVRSEDGAASLIALAYEHLHEPVALKNLLQVAILASDEEALLKHAEFPLEQQDLSGMRFVKTDLSRTSLRRSDLTDVDLVDCALEDSVLDGAIFRNTFIDAESAASLIGAELGDLGSFHSLRLATDRVIVDFEEAQAWFAEKTARAVTSIDPCPWAMQLRHMLGKYVRPTGQARRSWLDSRAIVAGTRHVTDVHALADSLGRHSFLVVNRGRYDRPGGDEYGQIVEFVKNMTLSSGLRRVLNDVCDRPGCAHVPRQVREPSPGT